MASSKDLTRWLALGVIGIALIAPWHVVADDDDDDRGGRCRLAGTWIDSTSSQGQRNMFTIVPQDNSGKRFAAVTHSVNEDPSFQGLVPATSRSPFRGETVRIGRDTYEFTWLAYAINQNSMTQPGVFDVVYIEVVSGILELTDCGTMERTLTASFYGPDQDPFGEDPPLLGCLGPFAASAERMPVVGLCEETSPPPF